MEFGWRPRFSLWDLRDYRVAIVEQHDVRRTRRGKTNRQKLVRTTVWRMKDKLNSKPALSSTAA
jgi:hypothetical protein